MRVLYHLWLSAFSRTIRVVLKEKSLDFTLKAEKVWERRPEFLALNPAGEVPVLIEPDGTVLADAAAIVEYLDEVYREKILIGINPVDRAEVRRLTAWFDVKMNAEVTENLLGEKMMRRLEGHGTPNSQAIRAGHANLPHHLDYIGYLDKQALRGEFLLAQDAGVAQRFEHVQMREPARGGDHQHAAQPQLDRRRPLLQQEEGEAERDCREQ